MFFSIFIKISLSNGHSNYVFLIILKFYFQATSTNHIYYFHFSYLVVFSNNFGTREMSAVIVSIFHCGAADISRDALTST